MPEEIIEVFDLNTIGLNWVIYFSASDFSQKVLYELEDKKKLPYYRNPDYRIFLN